MSPRNPPAYGHPDDSDERPPFVLIEPFAYFADRDNATTATCEMPGFHGTFKFTFCTARPPLVSYMCFHATHYAHTDFAVEPQIVATETNGSLVLLRVVFGDNPSAIMNYRNREYLVYDASGPSLEHLPLSGGVLFTDESVAFVRKCTERAGIHDCTKCSYAIVAHSGGFGYADLTPLYIYHPDTGNWITKQVRLKLKPSQNPDLLPYHSTSKAITIAGGNQPAVAWVDLSHNILLCNVLADHPGLHPVQLPPADDTPDGDPSSVRDIALVNGLFKYVEMQFHVHKRSGHAYWEATVWKTSRSEAKGWDMEYQLKSSQITLPKLRVDPGEPQPNLSTLHIGLPNLSLQDDGIVYFLSKVYHCDNNHLAWVLAVDMRNKKIQKVGEFSPTRTLGLAKGYNATTISKFLKGR